MLKSGRGTFVTCSRDKCFALYLSFGDTFAFKLDRAVVFDEGLLYTKSHDPLIRYFDYVVRFCGDVSSSDK